MGRLIRRREDDHGLALTTVPPLPHHRNRQEQLPLPGKRRHHHIEEAETDGPTTRRLRGKNPQPGLLLNGNPGQDLSGNRHPETECLSVTCAKGVTPVRRLGPASLRLCGARFRMVSVPAMSRVAPPHHLDPATALPAGWITAQTHRLRPTLMLAVSAQSSRKELQTQHARMRWDR